MKYMFVSQTLSCGGAERVISVISTALTELGEDVVAVKYFDTEGEYERGSKVRIVNLSEGDIHAYKTKGKIRIIKALRKAIKDHKPDCIIPFTYPVAQVTELATVGLNVPVFQSIRINPAIGPVPRWKRVLRDLLVYRSRCTFVQNKQQAEYFKASYQSKIHVLSNPVSNDLFLVEPKSRTEKFRISALGRLTEQKNYPLLIDAFSEAFVNDNKVELCIYGEGVKKQKLQDYIDEMKMSSQIKLMGRTNDVLSVYRNTDVYVLSSDFEGMPNALIEAMACHIVCISTDCPTGPSDLIQNYENGFLVPIRDKQALKEALLKAYTMTDDERLTMSNNGRETVRKMCSSQNIAEQMNTICKSIVKRGIS